MRKAGKDGLTVEKLKSVLSYSKETALILRLHNAWRRGYENAPNMTEPKLLGEVIDSAISLIEQHDELLAAKTNLRQQVAHMTDQLAGEKSNVELANRQRDELLTALVLVLLCSISETKGVTGSPGAIRNAESAISSVRKSQGKCYYAPDGTLMNPDGTRSIFDDVDQ